MGIYVVNTRYVMILILTRLETHRRGTLWIQGNIPLQIMLFFITHFCTFPSLIKQNLSFNVDDPKPFVPISQ